MRLVRLILAMLLLFGNWQLTSQTMEYSYISSKKKSRFNLPTLGVSLKLPAKAGFNVDTDDKLEYFLDIDKRINYFFNNDALADSKPVSVRFSLPDSDQCAMLFVIMKIPDGITETDIYQSYINSDIYKTDKRAVKTRLGKSKGFVYNNGDNEEYTDLIIHNSYLYIFQYAPSVQKFCEKIIKSFGVRNLDKYLPDYEKSLTERKEDEENEELYERRKAESVEYKGIFDKHTELALPQLGINMGVPAGYSYRFNAKYFDINNPVLNLDIDDLKAHSVLLFDFGKNGLFAMYRLWDNMDSPKERIKHDTKYQKEIKRFNLLIDGVKFEAVALGSEEMPTINAYAQLNGFAVSLSFMYVKQDFLPEVENLLNNITFSANHKTGNATKEIKPISQQLTIKKYTIEQVPYVYFPESGVERDLVNYSFPQQGFSCSLPVGIDVNNNTVNSDCVINKDLDSAEHGFIMTAVSLNEYKDNFSLVITKNAGTTLEEYLNTMKKNWETYEIIKIKKYGIGLVNGKEWGIMHVDQSGVENIMFFTFYNNIIIMLTCVFREDADMQLCNDLLYTFEYP